MVSKFAHRSSLGRPKLQVPTRNCSEKHQTSKIRDHPKIGHTKRKISFESPEVGFFVTNMAGATDPTTTPNGLAEILRMSFIEVFFMGKIYGAAKFFEFFIFMGFQTFGMKKDRNSLQYSL